jgi:PKD repeat protein
LYIQKSKKTINMKKLLLLVLCILLFVPATIFAQTGCNPQFTWTPAPVSSAPLQMSFTNTTIYTTPSLTYMPEFQINYGDNTNGYISTSAYHTYTTPGTYTVKLYMVVHDSLNATIVCSDSIAHQVVVAYPPCASSITQVNNGSGSYTFTAVNPANTPGLVFNWNFGDGNTGAGATATHAYTASGYFTVTLQVTGTSCTSTAQTNVNYFNGTISCDSLEASFITNILGLSLDAGNTSTQLPFPNVTRNSFWIFGDGATTNTFSGTHNYSSAGTYTVTLVNSWVDTITQNVLCVDSVSNTYTFMEPNYISGSLHWDPAATQDSVYSFKVWLITHDATANTLIAIDSMDTYPWSGSSYQFDNIPAGNYLVKAAPLYIPVIPASGLVPTYHDASVYWSGAANIVHAAGSTSGKDIWMQNGTPTTGPGFVGGNISAGAGKGTGTGVAGILVFLRNSINNKMVASAYTDGDGNYAFTDIGTGTYNVYPEDMNYATTPSAAVGVTSGQTNNAGIDFEQTEDEILPKTTLGIDPLTKNDALSIYPNPLSDLLIIDNKNGNFTQVTVVNTLGQVVKQADIKKGMNKVGMETLRSGIYYLVVKGNDGTRSMKITKK